MYCSCHRRVTGLLIMLITVLKRKSLRGVIVFSSIFFILSCSSFAQEKADSVRVVPSIEKSPSGALLRSALMPGWGQWYTDHKFKAILVFGAQLALIGNAVYYNQMAVRSRTSDERDFYLDYRSRFTWYAIGFYLLNLLDAFVDGHLWNFDTGPDLSVGGAQEGKKGIFVRLCWSL
jgi:hypothetical protein